MNHISAAQPSQAPAGNPYRVPLRMTDVTEAFVEDFQPTTPRQLQATQLAYAVQGPQETSPADDAGNGMPPAPAASAEAQAQVSPIYGIGDVDVARGQGRPREDVPQMELTLDEFIDIINPLQHIPLVASLYRSLTGDEISGSARIMGDTLYGGPLGLVSGIANAITEEVTGRDIAGTALAALTGGGEETLPGEIAPGVMLAQAAAEEAAGVQVAAEEAAGLQVAALAAPTIERVTAPPAALETFLAAEAEPAAADEAAESQVVQAPQLAGLTLPPATGGLFGKAPVTQLQPIAAAASPGRIAADPSLYQAPPEGPLAEPVSDPRLLGAGMVKEAFADRMLQALDSYRSMMRDRPQVAGSTGQRFDGIF